MPKAPSCSPNPKHFRHAAAMPKRRLVSLTGDGHFPGSQQLSRVITQLPSFSQSSVFSIVYGQSFVILKDGLSPFIFYAYGLDSGSIPCSVVYLEEWIKKRKEKNLKTSSVSTISSSDVTGAAAVVWDLPSGNLWGPGGSQWILLVPCPDPLYQAGPAIPQLLWVLTAKGSKLIPSSESHPWLHFSAKMIYTPTLAQQPTANS